MTMKRLLAVATIVATLFLCMSAQSQFLYDDACKEVDGEYNLGYVKHIIGDPLSPKTAFYTVSQDAVCHAPNPTVTQNSEGQSAVNVSFDKVITPEDIGASIRDAALSRSGAMAVIGGGENKFLDQKVWFRDSPSAIFHEITEIAQAELGRVEDVWLNGAGDVLVAVSATKVGTWKRVGSVWSLSSLTILSDIGVGYFPTVHDIHSECVSTNLGVGIRIIGHPDGEHIYIDALRFVQQSFDWRKPCDLLDPLVSNKPDYPTRYGFMIETNTSDWSWRKPVFVEEEWCRTSKWFGYSNDVAWDVVVDPTDHSIAWAVCKHRGSNAYGRRTAQVWAKVKENWSNPGGVDAGYNSHYFFSTYFGGVGGLMEISNRLGYIEYREETQIMRGPMGLVGQWGADLPPPVNGTGHGIHVDGLWTLVLFGRELSIVSYPTGEEDIYIDRKIIRVGWNVVDACTVPDKNLMAVVNIESTGHVFDNPPRRLSDVGRVDLWEVKGGEPIRLLKTIDMGELYATPILCAIDGFEDSIVWVNGRGRYKLDIASLEIDRDDEVEEFVKAIFSYHQFSNPRFVREEGECIPFTGGYYSGRTNYNIKHYRNQWGCDQIWYRTGHGMFVLHAGGIHWADPDKDGDSAWDNRVLVVDDRERTGNQIGLCGSSGSPAVLVWVQGIVPECIKVDVSTASSIVYVPDLQVGEISNFPNPFSTETTLTFAIDKPGVVIIETYGIDGRRVTHSDHGLLQIGIHRLAFQGAPLPAGVYLLRISVDGVTTGRGHRIVRI